MTRWAVLVGVDYYGPSFKEDELRSCVADVSAIEEFLVNSPVPLDHYDILTLTSTKNTNLSESEPSEDFEARATIKNFIDRLQVIKAQGRAGDHVYIHYSGHGSKRKNDVILTFYNEKMGKIIIGASV
jgi:hypothetical protein